MEIIKLPPVTKKCKRKAFIDDMQYRRKFRRINQPTGLSNKIKHEYAILSGDNRGRKKNG